MCIVLNEIFTVDKVPVIMYPFFCSKRILPDNVNLQAVHCLSLRKISFSTNKPPKGKTEGIL